MNEIKQLQIDNQKKTVPSYYYALVFERLKDWKMVFESYTLQTYIWKTTSTCPGGVVTW